MKFRWLWTVLPPVIVFIAFIAMAEGYLRWQAVPKYLVPTPSAVWQEVVASHEDLTSALLKTTDAAMRGFIASAIIGVALAVVLSSARVIRNAFYPYTVFFQTVPVVAIAPLLLIWCGPGMKSVAICAFVVSVFPVIANTLAGLMSVDPALKDLFTLYGAGPIARLFKLRLPAALPNIFTGLRIAAGLAVIGAIVGEFIVGDLDSPGLGVMIAESAKFSRTARVFAAILAASLLGVVMLSVLNLAGYLTLRRWHASEKE